jgi:hypothetical protein
MKTLARNPKADEGNRGLIKAPILSRPVFLTPQIEVTKKVLERVPVGRVSELKKVDDYIPFVEVPRQIEKPFVELPREIEKPFVEIPRIDKKLEERAFPFPEIPKKKEEVFKPTVSSVEIGEVFQSNSIPNLADKVSSILSSGKDENSIKDTLSSGVFKTNNQPLELLAPVMAAKLLPENAIGIVSSNSIVANDMGSVVKAPPPNYSPGNITISAPALSAPVVGGLFNSSSMLLLVGAVALFLFSKIK